MRLIDLEPQWLIYKRRRVGFIFRSPTDPKWRQTCFVESFPVLASVAEGGVGEWSWAKNSQAGIIARSCNPPVGDDWQGCRPDFCWTIIGGIEAAAFETMSVTPSLDGSRGGLWHGHVTDGQIVGGL